MTDHFSIQFFYSMRSNFLKLRLLYILPFLFLSGALSAADIAAGKTLFSNNCGTCHAKDMKSKLTGPPLSGVQAKWGDDKALYSWIRNSQASIAAGQPNAVAIWNEYKPTVMTAFPNLKDDEIASILLYVADAANGGGNKGTAVVAKPGAKKSGNGLMYGLVFALLAGLALALARIISNLNRTVAAAEGANVAPTTLVDTLTSKGVIGFVVFALIVLGGYTTVNNAISLGRSQEYAPSQPIKFSHATHAGIQKIDCQYCHDGARRSKHSIIPATNTCMNCHKAITKGSQYGTAEITKIFASIGFDPNTGKYIPNYDNLKEEQVAEVYKTWIATNYAADKKLDPATAAASKDVKLVADAQWNDIAKSLKTEIKDKVQGPIQWKRVHNLPDHVYFNHAQHVTVGKVTCQKCHGEVEKMGTLKQASPLSMGWCVNCHRETEVKFKDNDYYKSYARYHEEIKKGTREKVTVEDIGGLECQKCHY
jgi:mono/diheme cytochrome c family protein